MKARNYDARMGIARVPGSCGELAQGWMNGRDAHITCPVDLYSKAEARIIRKPGVKAPSWAVKAKTAVEHLLAKRNLQTIGAELLLSSDLSIGKGMASSTADIAAACWATAAALDEELSAADVADIALAIEPTDGTIFRNIVRFDHISGGPCKYIGSLELDVILLEPPGIIDTVAFSKGRPRYDEPDLAGIRDAFTAVEEGISGDDPLLLGEGATLSARINQRYLPKPHLEELIALSLAVGSVGINVAHSGTVIGVLCRQGTGSRVLDRMYYKIPRDWKTRLTRLISGGPVLSDAAGMMTLSHVARVT